MDSNSNRRQGLKILLGTLLVFSLVSIVLHISNRRALQREAEKVTIEDPAVDLSIRTLETLLFCENSFLAYTVSTGQDDYTQYRSGLDQLSRQMDSLEILLVRSVTSGDTVAAGKEKSILRTKTDLSAQLSNIRYRLDSLLFHTTEVISEDSVPVNSPVKNLSHKKMKDYVFSETLRNDNDSVTVRKRKKLLARLAEALYEPQQDTVSKIRTKTIDRTSKEYTLIDEAVELILTRSSSYYKQMTEEMVQLRLQQILKEQELTRINFSLMRRLREDINAVLTARLADNEAGRADAVKAVTSYANALFALAILSALLIPLLIFWLMKARRHSQNYQAAMIAERNRALELAREKTSLLSTMSHEFRTPLHSVIGFIDHLKYTDINAEQKQLLESAQFSSNLLLNLANDILDLGKLESGRYQPAPAAFDAHATIAQIISVMHIQADKKGLSLRMGAAAGDALWLHGDVEALRHILINLIGNAVKFTHEGEVSVNTHLEPINGSDGRPFLVISVRDSGPGIAPQIIDNLFHKYYQGDEDKSRGSGLGLYICRLLLEAQGGTIAVESQPGEGATFTMRLPVDLLQSPPQEVATGQVAPAGDFLRNKRLLIVDDDPLNLQLIDILIRNRGGQTDKALSGREALGLLRQHRYDAVLTDIMMPGMDGRSFIQAARQIPGPKDTMPFFLALTGLTDKEEMTTLQEAGFSHVIPKPFREKEVMNTLWQLFSARDTGSSASEPI